MFMQIRKNGNAFNKIDTNSLSLYFVMEIFNFLVFKFISSLYKEELAILLACFDSDDPVLKRF